MSSSSALCRRTSETQLKLFSRHPIGRPWLTQSLSSGINYLRSLALINFFHFYRIITPLPLPCHIRLRRLPSSSSFFQIALLLFFKEHLNTLKTEASSKSLTVVQSTLKDPKYSDCQATQALGLLPQSRWLSSFSSPIQTMLEMKIVIN